MSAIRGGFGRDSRLRAVARHRAPSEAEETYRVDAGNTAGLQFIA